MQIDNFLTYLRLNRHYSELTIQSYQTDLLQFENFLTKDDNDKSVLENDNLISTNAIRSWIMTLTESKISPRSINRKISSLRAYFRWIELNDLDFENPTLKIINPKTSYRKMSAIPENDMQTLLDNLRNEEDFIAFRNYLIILLLYVTGIRQAELLSIKEGDISLMLRQIRIIGKGNKERIIPLGEEIISKITKYIDLKRRYNIEETTLFTDEKGKRLSKFQLYSMVHKLLENIAVSERSPHVFRHTCATHLVNEGANIMNVKSLLGHSSIQATEVYTHTTIEELKKEYKRSFDHNFNK
jgi:integrase/recombinase XerC